MSKPKKQKRERALILKNYKVGVCRISYGYATLDVTAPNQRAAKKLALDNAGDHSFSEHTADYKMDYIREAPKE
jgi:hypothetical protein